MTPEEWDALPLKERVKITFEEHILSVLESRDEYGDSLKSLRTIYFTDRISSKIHRVKNLENNAMRGRGPKNEGISAELKDIISYGFFALMRCDELGPCPKRGNNNNETKEWAKKYFGIQEANS